MSNSLEQEMHRLAINIARLLSGQGGMPSLGSDRYDKNPFKNWNWNTFLRTENPEQGLWRFWVEDRGSWGDPFNQGAYIELKNPRPDPQHEPKVEFGPLIPIGQAVIENSSNEVIQNSGKTPLEFERESERTRSYTTSDDVGVSLTIGFEQKIGNDNTFASATFKQEVTASYNKHMESSIGGTETVSVSGTVEPGHKRNVSRLVERTNFEQTNKVSGVLDCQIYLFSFWRWEWWFDSLEKFTETIAGRGKDWWGLEHDLAKRFRERPADEWAQAPFRDRPRIEYEKKVKINASTQGSLVVSENLPL